MTAQASAALADVPVKPAIDAYAQATRRDRFTEKAINRILIIFTLLVNWILLWGGFTRLWGLYVALVFGMILIAVDAARLTYVMFVTADPLPAYMSAPFTQSDVRVYILVWLVWFVVTQFFFISGTSFGVVVSLLTGAPMLIAATVVSVMPLERSLARNLFPLLALFALAFPSRLWMPQQEWWVFVVLRVVLYFTAVVVASYALPRRELSREAVKHSVAAALSLDQKALRAFTQDEDDAEDAERVTFSVQLSTIVAHYQDLCNYERERTLSIIALSAWILVVSRVVALAFGGFLIILQLVLFFVRRREFDKQTAQRITLVTKADKPPTIDVNSGGAMQGKASKPPTPPASRHSPIAVMPPPLAAPDDSGDGEATDDAEHSIEASGDDEASATSIDQPPVQNVPSVVVTDDVHRRRVFTPVAPNTPPPNLAPRDGVRTNRVTIKTR